MHKFSRRMRCGSLAGRSRSPGRCRWGGPSPQDREKELNILCWEGYNSAQVLDPFRTAARRDRQGRSR